VDRSHSAVSEVATGTFLSRVFHGQIDNFKN